MREYYGCRTCRSADKQLEEYIRTLPMETSHHRVDSQDTNADLVCRVFAADCVPMDPAALPRKRQRESVGRMRTRLLQETS